MSRCENCPVIFFCRGGCPLNVAFKEDECRVKFNFYIQVLQFAVYKLTGSIPTHIDGEFYNRSEGFER
jgi:sulfatase maturation enzyme AslB (radical SAM superfamily)